MTHKGFYFFEFVFFVVLAIPFWIALATPYSPPALRFATYCNASALNVPTVNNKPPARSRVLQCNVWRGRVKECAATHSCSVL